MQTLNQFYQEIQQWIDAGCPDHEIFNKSYGLCVNVVLWSNSLKVAKELSHELEWQFRNAGLSHLLPFNRSFDNRRGNSYEEEAMAGTIFQNPKRLEWVRQHAKAV